MYKYVRLLNVYYTIGSPCNFKQNVSNLKKVLKRCYTVKLQPDLCIVLSSIFCAVGSGITWQVAV